jgi:hypothetical protein
MAMSCAARKSIFSRSRRDPFVMIEKAADGNRAASAGIAAKMSGSTGSRSASHANLREL